MSVEQHDTNLHLPFVQPPRTGAPAGEQAGVGLLASLQGGMLPLQGRPCRRRQRPQRLEQGARHLQRRTHPPLQGRLVQRLRMHRFLPRLVARRALVPRNKVT